jgi:hypothetical protein
MNDASRGGLRGSWRVRCRMAGTWVPHYGTLTLTALSLELWAWLTRWPGFSSPVAIRATLVGGWYARLSLIRRLTHPGNGARGARYRWCRGISSDLPVIPAGRRWRAPNISPPSAAPSRSPLTLTKPQSWRICGWNVPQELPNAGA